ASAMTTFNVRIPGLKLTVVQADGLDVRPVEVDEFQIAVAETYDIIVTPTDDRAYTLIGESVDRSGMARATLAPREGMAAQVPALRKRPLADMK
ncbi:copper-binding protein, partial [Klebsiella pneumoniae]